MEILFLGVGEACDESHPNTSLLVTTDKGACFLLDCGFTTPHLYFGLHRQADELTGVWISHFHGDHFFGIPLLLLRFWEMGREKPLIIVGQVGVQEKVLAAMELAYPGFMGKLQYQLLFKEIKAGQDVEISDISLQTAENTHSQPSFSVRIDDGKHRLFYSGDGRPTAESQALSTGCDLVVHESFWLDKEVRNHGNVVDSIAFAKKSEVPRLALVHLERNFRKEAKETLCQIIQEESLYIFLPESGDLFTL